MPLSFLTEHVQEENRGETD